MAAILAIMTYYPHQVTSSGHVATQKKDFWTCLSKFRCRSLTFLGVKKVPPPSSGTKKAQAEWD